QPRPGESSRRIPTCRCSSTVAPHTGPAHRPSPAASRSRTSSCSNRSRAAGSITSASSRSTEDLATKVRRPCLGRRTSLGSTNRSAAGESFHVFGGQRLSCDPPVAAANLLDDTPGDGAHVLALDLHHGVGEVLDDLLLLLGAENALNELDV